MFSSRTPYTIGGQFVTALTIVALIISPFGCQTLQLLTGDTDDLFGMLINSDLESNTLGALRLASGETVFLYGSFQEDGNIKEITGITLRDADGQEASLIFEEGRPTAARSFDGSTINITYDEVSSERLTGQLDIFFASTSQSQSIPFDIDLQAAASQLAQIVADLTGSEISDEEPPAAPSAEKRAGNVSAEDTSKQEQRAQLGLIAAILVQYAFVILGLTIVSIMVQSMQAAITSLVVTSAIVTKTVVVALFSPFILMGEILRLAMTEPVITIDFEIVGTTVIIPGRPDF